MLQFSRISLNSYKRINLNIMWPWWYNDFGITAILVYSGVLVYFLKGTFANARVPCVTKFPFLCMSRRKCWLVWFFFFLFGFLFVSCRWNSWNFFACNISETIIKETGICLLTHMIPLFYYTMLGSSYELC